MMSDEVEMVAEIRANATLVAEMARKQLGETIHFDEASVQWLDGFLQRQHESGDPKIRDGLVNTLGSFLGECIVRSFGGGWAEADGTWCVRFDESHEVYPFNKVSKQLENGREDSVVSFFTFIPMIFHLPSPEH